MAGVGNRTAAGGRSRCLYHCIALAPVWLNVGTEEKCSASTDPDLSRRSCRLCLRDLLVAKQRRCLLDVFSGELACHTADAGDRL